MPTSDKRMTMTPETMTPEKMTDELAAALGPRLKCVALYGSAAAGDFVPGASNFNLLVVVDPLSANELDLLAAPIGTWRKAGHLGPLLFTPDQLKSSADAFAIELLDIRQSRRILWGEDLLAEIRVVHEHLRLQVERELTGKLLALRGAYVAASGRPEAVGEVMLRSLSTFLVLFRAALRLHEETVPAKKLDALLGLSKYLKFDARPFQRLSELKEQRRAASDVAAEVRFADYLAAIESVAATINHSTHP